MNDPTATPTPDPRQQLATITSTTPTKPGYKTTEFYLSAFASFVGMAISMGLVPTTGEWPRIAGLIVCLLSSLGYTAQRGIVKFAALLCVLCCLLFTGCLAPVTVNVFSSRLAVSVPSGTNATPITLTIDGGAAVMPSVGLGDAVSSNLATTAKDALETSTGISAASTVVTTAAKAATK